jgi:hypothetical protein
MTFYAVLPCPVRINNLTGEAFPLPGEKNKEYNQKKLYGLL